MTTQRTIFIATIVILLFCGWFFLRNPQRFPIRSVQINATYQHIKPQVYREVITPFLKSSFFSINVTDLERTLVRLPWVKRVEIKRIWPNVIAFTIHEEHASAYWNKDQYINEQGDVFSPEHVSHDMDLPSISGPKGWSKNLWERYNQMNAGVKPLELSVTRLAVNVRHSWRITLTDVDHKHSFSVVLGRDDIEARWDRFLKSYKRLMKNKKRFTVIDLRYPSGFSVS